MLSGEEDIGAAGVRDQDGMVDLGAFRQGFYPKAMYYCGSDEVCHFFEQETPLGDLTLLSKKVRTIMVSRSEVTLPGGAEFEHFYYMGREDPRRQLMRIQITQRNPNRGAAEYARADYLPPDAF